MESSRRPSWDVITPSAPLRTGGLAFAVASVCYLSSRLADALVIYTPQMVWPLWPGCAVLVAILLLVPKKIWPLLLPAGLAGFVLYDWQAGVPIPAIAWLNLSDAAEVLTAAFGVSYALKERPRLNSLKALARYSFFTFLAAFIASSININGLNGDRWLNWRFSFLSEALSFVTVTPAILGLFGRGRQSLRTPRVHYWEAAILMSALVSLSSFIFLAPGSAPPALLYSLMPFLIWSALRFGSTGVGLSATAVAFMSIWGAVHGRGPFTETDPVNRVLSLQLFLFFASVPFMVLAVLVEERRIGQEDLRKSEERLRSAMESGKAVGWEWDLKSGQDSWFGDLKTMFGIATDSFSGRPEDFHRYVHPEDRKLVADAVAEARKTHTPYAAEFRVVWADGTLRWVSASGKFYYSSKGEPERMLGMAVDVTERKLAEDSVSQSEEKYRRIVETTNEGIWVLDSKFDTSYVNRQMAGMLGYQPAEMLGRSVFDFYFPEDVERRRQILARRQDGVSEHFDERFRRRDGAELWVRMAAIPTWKDNGEFDGALAMVGDITDRRRAEEALRESEERFRLVANTAPMLIWMSDTDKLCTYFNQSWLAFTARPLEMELGNGWTEGVHLEDLQTCIETYVRAFDAREKFRMEYRLRRYDGEYRWILDIGVPRFNQDGSFAGYIGSCVDVTDLKRAEEVLRQSEERERTRVKELETILDAVPMPVRIAHDPACQYMTGNRAEYEQARVPRMPPGRNLSSSGPIHERPLYRLMENGQWVAPESLPMQQAAATGKPVRERALTVVYEDGTRRETLEYAVPLLDEAGKPRGAVGASIDVTERKQAEDALRESEQKLRLLLDSTAEAIYGKDLEGRCTFCNQACLRTLGYESADELLGKNMHDLIHHTHSDGTFFPEEECGILQTLQTGKEIHRDDEVLWRANGTSFPAEYWSYPQRRGQQVIGAVVAFLDITERKVAEEALANVSRRLIEAQEQERSRIARELHDDISQRLSLLTIELEQLERTFPELPSEVQRRIDELHTQSSELATDVQSMSHQLHSSKLEYLGITTAMRAFCKEFSDQQNVEVFFVYDDVPRTLPKDISLCFFRVLQEALQNAVKHSRVRHFDVELRYVSDGIDLMVRDSGIGFDVEQALRSPGLGLVSMAERLKLVDGKLSINSQPQAGTTIHAFVPLSKVARAAV